MTWHEPGTLGRPSGHSRHEERRAASEAFAVGLSFDVVSLVVANPYLVFGMTVVLAAYAAVRLRQRNLAWTALAATLSANPVNPSASIACNVVVAGVFLLMGRRRLLQAPRWLLAATALTLASFIGSVAFWRGGITPEAAFTQTAALVNFVLAPIILLPALFSGVGDLDEPEYLVRGLLLWLVAPSTLLLAAARLIGTPVSNLAVHAYQYELYSTYRLGEVDIFLTRTQVGIILAAMGCASFAIAVARIDRRWRLPALAGLLASTALMVLTGSIGSAIALMLGIAVVLAKSGRRANFGLFSLLCLAGWLVIANAEQVMPSELYTYAAGRFGERFSEVRGIGATDRVKIWATAAQYSASHSNGIGWSLYLEELAVYPHNDYLSYAIAWGVLCGAVYAFTIARLWWSSMWRRYAVRDGYRLALGLAGLGATTVLLVNSMSDHLTSNRWYFNVVWSIAWYCYFAAGGTGGRQLRAPRAVTPYPRSSGAAARRASDGA